MKTKQSSTISLKSNQKCVHAQNYKLHSMTLQNAVHSGFVHIWSKIFLLKKSYICSKI